MSFHFAQLLTLRSPAHQSHARQVRPLRAEVAELRSRIDAGLLTADEARRLEDRD